MKWTDETIELLKKLHAQGLSAGQISDRFGCTRNSICGKLARLGYREGKKTRPRPRQSSIEKPPRSIFNPTFSFGKKPSTQSLPLTSDQKEYILGQGVPLKDDKMQVVGEGKDASIRWSGGLRPDQCRWPINSPRRGEEYLFCGAPITTQGCSYCGYHMARAYGPSRSPQDGTPSERRATEAAGSSARPARTSTPGGRL